MSTAVSGDARLRLVEEARRAVPILVVSDMPAEARAIGAMLKFARIVHVPTPADGGKELAKTDFAAVLCTLPGDDASYLESVASMRDQARNPTPTLLLTPPGVEHAKVIRNAGTGCVDAVAQPIEDAILHAKVCVYAELYRVKRQLADFEANGTVLLSDALTGLPNRTLFLDRANQAIRVASRSGGKVAVAVLDVDEVRDVREMLGPHTGDELLRLIAGRLSGSLRCSDTAARVSDYRLAAVLACDTRDGVASVSARLERVMSDPFVVGGHRITLSAAIGVAMYPEHGKEAHVLKHLANQAMLTAKRNNLGHLLYDPIQHGDDSHAEMAEMNTEELFQISAA
jgi:diguanylate cyclase (GGDEF)-like protein